MKNPLICLTISALFVFLISCQKNNVAKTNKPEALSQELFCVGCLVIAFETAKLLNGRKNEADVYHALEKVCYLEHKSYS
jgi:hypothetical protein